MRLSLNHLALLVKAPVKRNSNPDADSENPVSSSAFLQRVGGSQFSPLLQRVLPPYFRERMRSLLGWWLIRVLGHSLSPAKGIEQPLEDAEASGSISIIVPVHDSPAVTRRCLASLERFAPRAEIILVDDASKLDETRELLDEASSRNGWKLIRHLKALGHSGACKAGADASTRRYLCLLNSDTIVTPWCWLPIVQAFESDPKIGAAGPSTSNAGNAQVLPLANTLRHYLNDDQICEFARRLRVKNPLNAVEDLDWLSGFALFIRRSLWVELGGFDPNLPDYSNDVDLLQAYPRCWISDGVDSQLLHTSPGRGELWKGQGRQIRTGALSGC